MSADKDGVELPEGCPACGALPCDWAGGANPHAFCDSATSGQVQEWSAGAADWLKIAKAAGEHGVRFRTNRALISFLNEIGSTSPTPAQEQGLLEEAEAVLERALIGSQKYLRARVRTAISLIEKARHSSTPTEGAQ